MCYLLFCVCYLNSVSFIELLRSFCIHGEACAKILCSEKELLNLKDSKLTQNFYGNKTRFVRTGHIKTHGSESRGQEEAAVRDERVSYLHVALL